MKNKSWPSPPPVDREVERPRQEGRFYTDIAKDFLTIRQVRSGIIASDTPAPRLRVPYKKRRRWSDNPWLQGEKSPHALLDEKQVRDVLGDWDDEKGYWRNAAGHWAKLLRVSPSTILAVRRGDTWKHLDHPNAGRKKQ